MFSLISSEIDEYASKHSEPEDEILQKLYRETHLKVLQPRMLSGHLQGKFLEFISKIMMPEKILEIGTYTGYSAICLSKGLKEKGKLFTIEKNRELENIAVKYFEQAGIMDKIKYFSGNALEIIPTINEMFDLVFIDADKGNYINYFNLILNKVRKGGVIIADNVLWSGKILTNPHSNDYETIELQKFNKYITEHKDIENFILPFRDGLMLMYKK